jgi:hypothetical protein
MFERVRARIEGAVSRAVVASVEGRAVDPVDGIIAGTYLGLVAYAAQRFGGSPPPRTRVDASATYR